MRTLKKTLCLMLAVVMVLGLGAFSVSAADTFSDEESITHTKAVALLTGLGVFEGDPDGSFNPNRELNRAEAAAIITRLQGMGKLASGKSTFTDLAGYEWAEPYIAYIEARGIANGNGDGTFNPGGKLTGSAFAKWLLAAIGYDVDYENMNGAQWEIGVARLVRTTNLDNGLTGFDLTANVDRDTAAQLAYTAATGDGTPLNASGNPTTVYTRRYNEGTTVNMGGGAIVTTAGEYTPDNGTILSTYFNVTSTSSLNTTDDDFGRPATIYTDNAGRLGWEKDQLKVVDDPVVVYTGSVKAGKVASDLLGYSVYKSAAAGSAAGATRFSINNTIEYTNTDILYGRSDDTTPATLNANLLNARNGATGGANVTVSVNANRTLAAAIAGLTGKGRVIEIFANADKDLERIVTIDYTVGKVRSVTTSNGLTYYNLEDKAAGAALATQPFVDPTNGDNTTAIFEGALAKGDIVTYATVSGKTYIYPTTQVSGYQSAYVNSGNNGGGSVTVDGTVYSLADGVWTNNANNTRVATGNGGYTETNRNVTLYLDQYDYVVDIEGETSNDYVFVAQTANLFGNDTGKNVFYIDMEGVSHTVSSLKTNAIANSTDYLINNTGNDAWNIGWYKISEDGSNPGYYIFEAVSQYYQSTATSELRSANARIFNADYVGKAAAIHQAIQSNTGAMNDSSNTAVVATSATTFILKTNDGYKAYKGLSNIPTYTTPSTPGASNVVGEKYAVLDSDNAYAKVIFIDVSTGTSSGDSSTTPIYLLSNSQKGSGYDDGTKTTYYLYDAIVNGEKTQIRSTVENTLPIYTYGTTTDSTHTGGLVTTTSNNNGFVTAVAEVNTTSTKYAPAISLTQAAGTIAVSGNTMTVDPDGPSASVTPVQYLTLADNCTVYYYHGNNLTVGTPSDIVGTAAAGSKNGALYAIYKGANSGDHIVETIYYIGTING